MRPFVLARTPLETRERFTQRLAAFYVDQFRREPENAAWAVPHIVAIAGSRRVGVGDRVRAVWAASEERTPSWEAIRQFEPEEP